MCEADAKDNECHQSQLSGEQGNPDAASLDGLFRVGRLLF